MRTQRETNKQASTTKSNNLSIMVKKCVFYSILCVCLSFAFLNMVASMIERMGRNLRRRFVFVEPRNSMSECVYINLHFCVHRTTRSKSTCLSFKCEWNCTECRKLIFLVAIRRTLGTHHFHSGTKSSVQKLFKR